MAGRNSAAAGIGSAMFIACGLVALASSQLIGEAISLSTNDFLQLWSETFLMMIFGLLLLMAAFMIDSQNAMWPDIGTALGAVSALIGAVDSVVLLNFTGGLYEKAITGPYNVPQLAVFYVLLIGAVFVVLFVALPLGLVGSIRMFHGETVQSPEQS